MQVHLGTVAKQPLGVQVPSRVGVVRGLGASVASWLLLNAIYLPMTIPFLLSKQGRTAGIFTTVGLHSYLLDGLILFCAVVAAETEKWVICFIAGLLLVLFSLPVYSYSGPRDLAAAVQPLFGLKMDMLALWWPITLGFVFLMSRRRGRLALKAKG
jgi:hypothetical protein